MAKGLQKPDLGAFEAKISALKAEYDQIMDTVTKAEAHKRQVDADVMKATADMSAGVEGAEDALKQARELFQTKIDQINFFLGKAKEVEAKMSSVKDERDAAEAEGMTWVVGPGDSLSKIAKEVYGHANLYPKIFEANKDKIKNPNIILDGWVLKLPKL